MLHAMPVPKLPCLKTKGSEPLQARVTLLWETHT